MPPAKAHAIDIALQPLWTQCPRCGRAARRDYTNRRTLSFPDRTASLVLQILRCGNSKCPQYQRPYRPEMEWHYALPGTKFSLSTCMAVFAAHLDGKSNRAIYKALSASQFSGSLRSVANILRQYRKCFLSKVPSLSASAIQQFKSQRKATLDILVGCERPSYSHLLVRECFSNRIVGAISFSKENTDEDLRRVFHSVIDALPAQIVQVCCSPHEDVCKIAQRMWPRLNIVEITTDGKVGEWTTSREFRDLQRKQLLVRQLLRQTKSS